MYQTILSPLVTEKATLNNERGQVTFKVATDATKRRSRQRSRVCRCRGSSRSTRSW